MPVTRPARGRLAVVHPVGGERRELQKRRARIEQRVDPVPDEHLLLLRVARASGASLPRARDLLAQPGHERFHRVAVGGGIRRIRCRRGSRDAPSTCRRLSSRRERDASRWMNSTKVCVGVPGRKISRIPRAFNPLDVLVRNDAAGENDDVLSAPLLQELQDLREEHVVRPGEDRESDDVHVLLDGRRRDLRRRLPQPRIDDLHAGVAQGARDDLGAPVVPVEPGLGDQDPDWPRHGAKSSRPTSRPSRRGTPCRRRGCADPGWRAPGDPQRPRAP